MKHKHLTFLLSVLMSMAVSVASAHDFEVDGIYYNITSSSSPYTVAVTYQGTSYSSYSNEYTGSVTIPESVTYDDITYSVTSIAEFAFLQCRGLTSVTIPTSVTSIGGKAFYDCWELSSVTIPNSVTSIGSGVFERCTGLETIVVSSGNTVYDSREGCNAIIETASNTLIAGCKNTIIPNSVTSIGNNAFYGCSGLTSISIPNSVTSIGSGAFSGCSGLTSVTIPNSVTSIGAWAFEGCSGLTSVTIGNSVTNIGNWAFYNCSGLTSVTIGNSVTSIGVSAFYGTAWDNNLPDGLVYTGKVAYKYIGTMPEGITIVLEEGTVGIAALAFEGCSGLTSITIPNSIETIGIKAFRHCESLTSIVIPGSVKTLEEGIFSECYNLTTAVIEEGVETIGEGVFYMNKNVENNFTSVTIPSSVTSLGRWPFYGCSNLTRINCRATTPPSCEDNSLQDVPENCIIEVPIGCKAAYEAVSPWNNFTIVETEDPVEATTVTLAAEYGTFCSAKALDFTDVEGVKAYIASVFDTETGELTLTRVKKVKARTGLVLRGTPGQTYEIPEGTGTTVVANLLVGVTEDTELSPTDGNFTNFIMARNDAGGIGFFRVGGTSTLKAGKAYLQLPSDELSSEVKGFRMLFDDGDMSDGVETIHNEQFTIHNEADAVYDLQGRRVAKPTKGIYIVNGKKTVIK